MGGNWHDHEEAPSLPRSRCGVALTGDEQLEREIGRVARRDATTTPPGRITVSKAGDRVAVQTYGPHTMIAA